MRQCSLLAALTVRPPLRLFRFGPCICGRCGSQCEWVEVTCAHHFIGKKVISKVIRFSFEVCTFLSSATLVTASPQPLPTLHSPHRFRSQALVGIFSACDMRMVHSFEVTGPFSQSGCLRRFFWLSRQHLALTTPFLQSSAYGVSSACDMSMLHSFEVTGPLSQSGCLRRFFWLSCQTQSVHSTDLQSGCPRRLLSTT